MSLPTPVLAFLAAFIAGSFALLTVAESNVPLVVEELQLQVQEHTSLIQSLQKHIERQDALIRKILEQNEQHSKHIRQQESMIHTLLEQEQQKLGVVEQGEIIRSMVDGQHRRQYAYQQEDRQNMKLAEGQKHTHHVPKLYDHGRIVHKQGQNEDNERMLKQKSRFQQHSGALGPFGPKHKTTADMVESRDLGSNNVTLTMSSEYFHREKKQQEFVRGGRVVSSAVAFLANVRSTDVNHIGLGQKIVFDDVILNLGGAYQPMHGIFTAPSSGIYIFSASVLSFDSNHDIECGIMKNGVFLGGAFSNQFSQQSQGSATVVSLLDAGDQVWVANLWPADTSVHRDFTSFMGCLIS